MKRKVGGALDRGRDALRGREVGGGGWKVVVTREENKPATVEIKAGEAVAWTSATGGTAHIVLAGNEAMQFYVGGKEGGRVQFEKP